MNTLSGLASTGSLFNQVISLSKFPLDSFSSSWWSGLVSLLSSVLTNPFFYGVIWVIVVMTILPTVDDD